MEELSERHSKALWRIKKATDLGSFTVSAEAQSALQEMRSRPRLEWDENPPWEVYEQDYNNYRATLETIVSAARKDLRASKA